MKKNKIQMIVVLMLICGAPAVASTNANASAPVATNSISVEANVLIEKLERINEIDKSSMSRIEKKTLRKEVKSVEKQLKQMGNGVYMSTGAIIITILLLIILL